MYRPSSYYVSRAPPMPPTPYIRERIGKVRCLMCLYFGPGIVQKGLVVYGKCCWETLPDKLGRLLASSVCWHLLNAGFPQGQRVPGKETAVPWHMWLRSSLGVGKSAFALAFALAPAHVFVSFVSFAS